MIAAQLRALAATLVALTHWAPCPVALASDYDFIVRGGTVFDGNGGPGVLADVAVVGDRIAAVGKLKDVASTASIDATGLAVAPGFVNMLSWANESLIEDGRGESDLRQGVTLEVMGEGESMGPLNDAMKAEVVRLQGDIKYEVTWTTLGEYMSHLERRGISPNVASFVGATTVRVHEIGYEDRAPTAAELERMQELVRSAMREGALGVGSSLIYAPGTYAQTPELASLTTAAAEFGGGYVSHIRSEGDHYFEALDELISIAGDARTWAHVYHMKPAGERNWNKSAEGLKRLDAARAEGLDVSADIYTYTAGATGLDAAMPPWVQEGGPEAWFERMKDPAVRARVIDEIQDPDGDWESLYELTGFDPEHVLLIGFHTRALKPLTGKTLAEVASMRGTSPAETMIDLVVADRSRIDAAYFLMSEENIRRNIRWPHTMFGSDARAMSPQGVFVLSNTHPRAYGNVARLFARYVREQNVITVAEAVRRLTSLSTDTLRIRDRGRLEVGNYADIVVFDPATIQDHATYDEPHQLATGVRDVFVNGVQVLKNGEHTGAKPGRFVKGPGYRAQESAARERQAAQSVGAGSSPTSM